MTRKVAIITATETMMAWEAACVEALVDAGCEIALRVIRPAVEPRPAVFAGAASERSVELPPSAKHAATTSDVATAATIGADFALAFDDRLVRDVRLALPLGTWAFAFGSAGAHGSPPAYRELADGDGAIEAALVRVDRDPPVALKRGWFPTATYSYRATLDNARFGAAPWPARVVKELSLGCEPVESVFERADDPEIAVGAPQRLAFAFGLAVRRAGARLHDLFLHEHWNIAVVDRPIQSFLDRQDSGDARWLAPPPAGSFVADPFGRTVDGALSLLCEGYDYRDRRGYLMSGPVAGGRAQLGAFLRLPVHLSYPFIVEDGGEIYCIPESSEAEEIAIYRARSFPREWERVATLIGGFGGCDSSVIFRDGLWWLFCTAREAPNHELHAWWSEHLLGPWSAHARNPVKTDVRSARPAGTPFVADGVLYRPAQDCAGGYGRRVAINRVRRLTPTEFDEQPVAFVEPDARGPYRAGLHTLSDAGGGVTLIDGKLYRFVPRETARKAISYALKAMRGIASSIKGK
jgi:hypothetical protein